jgi:hypothetical protein
MTKKIITYALLIVSGLSFFPVNSLALTISPAKFEFSADPGDTIQSQITLINEQKTTLVFEASFERVTTRGSYGEPVFTGEKTGLASWIELTSSRVTLDPGEEKRIPLTIEVPMNADAGGNYAAIFWSNVPSEGGGSGMGITMRVAALVLLRVSGEVIEQGEILGFRVDKKFVNYLPIDFNFAFKNTGTVHLKPRGEIVIKNIFGRTTQILPVNSEGYNVLPDSERNFSANWQPRLEIQGKGFLAELKKEKADFAFGYYRATLDLEFGDTQAKQSLKSSLGFLVIPWRILLLSFLILGAVFFSIIQGIKRYNDWIIAKAGAQMNRGEIPRKRLIKKRKTTKPKKGIIKRKKTGSKK